MISHDAWNHGWDNAQRFQLDKEHQYDQQKSFYKNNNRVDRSKHAHINKPIHQPRKHNHEPCCNNRRNQ
jgi:hypothetical protein